MPVGGDKRRDGHLKSLSRWFFVSSSVHRSVLDQLEGTFSGLNGNGVVDGGRT